MAVYDYECENCGAKFEIERPMGFSGRVKCPKCGSTRTAKIFAPAGVVFKGPGFYVTDSAKKSSAAAPSSNGSSPESESKPAKPAPPKKKPDSEAAN